MIKYNTKIKNECLESISEKKWCMLSRWPRSASMQLYAIPAFTVALASGTCKVMLQQFSKFAFGIWPNLQKTWKNQLTLLLLTLLVMLNNYHCKKTAEILYRVGCKYIKSSLGFLQDVFGMFCELQQTIKLDSQNMGYVLVCSLVPCRVTSGSCVPSLFSVVRQLLSHFTGANTERDSCDPDATISNTSCALPMELELQTER